MTVSLAWLIKKSGNLTGSFSLGGKTAGLWSRSSSAEVKNKWSCKFTPPCALMYCSGMPLFPVDSAVHTYFFLTELFFWSFAFIALSRWVTWPYLDKSCHCHVFHSTLLVLEWYFTLIHGYFLAHSLKFITHLIMSAV